MMRKSLLAIYASSSSSSAETVSSLLLEQKPWGEYVGDVASANFLLFMKNLLYGAGGDVLYSNPLQFIGDSIARMKLLSQLADMQCGIGPDNTITTIIYAFATPLTLGYSLSTSYGKLTRGVREEIPQHENIPVNNADIVECKYPIQQLRNIAWQGDVFDSAGGIVMPQPAIAVVNGIIKLSRKVYGIISADYYTARDTYKLTVPARQNKKEDIFGAVVYGVFDGGVAYLEITAPPNADDLAAGNKICGWEGFNIIIKVERSAKIYKLPEVKANRTIDINYCSQKKENDDVF